jgi:indole-3-glycerol phosphate synthase
MGSDPVQAGCLVSRDRFTEEDPNANDIRIGTEVQASTAWTAPGGTLGLLVAEARQRADLLLSRRSELEQAAANVSRVPPFARALQRGDVAVVAEVKRRSPSKGWINPGLSAVDQARAYAAGGAAAISVLTEPDHFGGSIDDLVAVREAVSLPVLKKDFHVAPLQLVEAKAIGASAALLIVRALSPELLLELAAAANELDLEVLLEVRDIDEMNRAVDAASRSAAVTAIGVNNRNLETLVIDAGRAEELVGKIPARFAGIAESGVSSRHDVERAARSSADAVLVGSAVSAAIDPGAAVRDLTNVARVPRVG